MEVVGAFAEATGDLCAGGETRRAPALTRSLWGCAAGVEGAAGSAFQDAAARLDAVASGVGGLRRKQ